MQVLKHSDRIDPFIVLEAFGIDERLDFMPDRYGQVQKHWASNEKAKEILGFIPEISFEEGFQKPSRGIKKTGSSGRNSYL